MSLLCDVKKDIRNKKLNISKSKVIALKLISNFVKGLFITKNQEILQKLFTKLVVQQVA